MGNILCVIVLILYYSNQTGRKQIDSDATFAPCILHGKF
ncbi:hypothetical protein Hlac_3598 (plasmid) [Halorubrum lacusprofundi ATCC 49239]|uniref:Uncharacterized protein n=1 Tax=Halorubrum lacusprofundi (strain ATCC 49239 / DSM 5036 / JCM 8891 / ACAM 34) TaxID=416348 RepID=B9LXB4_HALLT|nr:hypothetical protein Hlac_3598 [Halorubrum lacusprofundi ATCC 49239]